MTTNTERDQRIIKVLANHMELVAKTLDVPVSGLVFKLSRQFGEDWCTTGDEHDAVASTRARTLDGFGHSNLTSYCQHLQCVAPPTHSIVRGECCLFLCDQHAITRRTKHQEA